MSGWFKAAKVALYKKLGVYHRYAMHRASYLDETGWNRSATLGSCVDGEGNPVPWITYPAIDFIGRRVRPEMSVFEYGCGASTLWWASRVKEVVSCEHDEAWHRAIAARVPDNVRVNFVALEPGGAYCQKAAERSAAYDVIVIDGRDRVNCALNALPALKADGVIVWDNSDRPDYTEGYEFLRQNGFKKIEFTGMAPLSGATCETSVFYRDDNCFSI